MGRNTLAGELKHSLIRVVQTSTAKVDRRHHVRHRVNLGCGLSGPGLGRHNAQVFDLSHGSAAIPGAPALLVGVRRSLEIDRIGTKLPFRVCAADEEAVHVTFELDTADAGRSAHVRQHMGYSAPDGSAYAR